MNTSDEVLVALRRIIRATDLHSRYLSKTSGLTAPQLLLMQSLNKEGAMIASALAKSVNLSQATVTNIIDRLEGKGLVVRQRSCTDKRKVTIFLTEAGTTMLDKAPSPLQDNFVDQLNQLESWEQSMILASLQRVATMMDAEKIDASPFLEIGDIDGVAQPVGSNPLAPQNQK